MEAIPDVEDITLRQLNQTNYEALVGLTSQALDQTINAIKYIETTANITSVRLHDAPIFKLFPIEAGLVLKFDKNEINKVIFSTDFSKYGKKHTFTDYFTRNEEKLSEIIKEANASNIRSYRSDMTMYNRDIRSYQTEIDRQLRKYHTAFERVEHLETAGYKHLLDEIKRVDASDHWHFIGIHDTAEMRFVNKNDIIVKHDGNEINFGKFEVRYSTGRLLVHKRENNIQHNFYHPHIDTNGSICWGQEIDNAHKMIKEGRLAEVLELLLTLLMTYCPDNPYESFRSFLTRQAVRCLETDNSIAKATKAEGKYRIAKHWENGNWGFVDDKEFCENVVYRASMERSCEAMGVYIRNNLPFDQDYTRAQSMGVWTLLYDNNKEKRIAWRKKNISADRPNLESAMRGYRSSLGDVTIQPGDINQAMTITGTIDESADTSRGSISGEWVIASSDSSPPESSMTEITDIEGSTMLFPTALIPPEGTFIPASNDPEDPFSAWWECDCCSEDILNGGCMQLDAGDGCELDRNDDGFDYQALQNYMNRIETEIGIERLTAQYGQNNSSM